MTQSVYSLRAIRPDGGLTLTRIFVALFLSAALVAIAIFVADEVATLVLLTVALTVITVVLLHAVQSRKAIHAAQLQAQSIADFIANDASPSFTTDDDGNVLQCNLSAEDRFGPEMAQETLARALRDLFANPAQILSRLQGRAEAKGSAREDVVTRRGHVRLAVHRITGNIYLWRLEDLVERSSQPSGAETLSLPMLTTSRSGTVLFMNDALRRLLGGRPKMLEQVIADLPLRPNSEHQILGADGPILARVVEIDGGGGRREVFFIPSRDAPPPLKLTHPMATAAVDGLPTAMLKLTRDGEIRLLNGLAQELLGPKTMVGANVGNLVEGLGRSMRDWLDDVASGRGRAHPEILKASQIDPERYVQMSLGRVVEGDQTLILAVMSDATELKSLEAQFVQSQKMHAIGQLAGGVAHDFNNLLTAISGHCDLLLLRHDDGDADYADLNQINQNANRAASLVGQLLAFSRKQTLQPEVFELSDTLSDLGHLLNRLVGERVTLSLNHDPALRPIRADKRQLEQVIVNLVVNARDAMPGGGDIRLATKAVTLCEPLMRDRATVPPGDYMLIQVVDSGVGIPTECMAKIFEPFFSTKRPGEGTGLGLSTAYGIVKQSGGYIFADSEIDKGSTFSVYLPAHDGPITRASPMVPEARIATPEPGEGVIMLVEDEAPVRAFASRALRLQGYTVIEAECAEDALEALEDKGLKIDVFVTDVIMPGMDGPTWVQLALKDRPDARVVFVSGYAEDSFADAQANIPNSVFLPKPFSLNDLTTTVQAQIH